MRARHFQHGLERSARKGLSDEAIAKDVPLFLDGELHRFAHLFALFWVALPAWFVAVTRQA